MAAFARAVDNGDMTSAPQLDLDGYLDRIAYRGPLEPTREVLDAILAHHAEAIPFENLDPFLGVPTRIDPDSLQLKLVFGGRGGFCFEQNLLLRTVLLRVGFEVRGLAARVRWQLPPEAVTPRSHMLLLASVDGEQRIADVGFGGMVVTGSIALASREPQETPLERFRVVDDDGGHALQAEVAGEWRPLYRFDMCEQLPVDYEASNWYLSTSPASKFVTTLMAARATRERRYALAGTRLSIHEPGVPSEHRVLADAGELREALEDLFGIDTGALDLDAAFAKATAG